MTNTAPTEAETEGDVTEALTLPGAALTRQQEQEARLGERLRAARNALGLSVRALARELGVSASFVSQLENGKARPSVATLYTMSSALGVSIDELFREDVAPTALTPLNPERTVRPAPRPLPGTTGAETGSDGANGTATASRPAAPSPGVVVRPADRRRLELNSGVVWQQLSVVPGGDIDFMFVTYDVGGSSTPDARLIRHGGVEYGFVTQGRLEVVLGFESHILEVGDSISFESTTPHRLTNVGDVVVEAIWVTRGRSEAH